MAIQWVISLRGNFLLHAKSNFAMMTLSELYFAPKKNHPGPEVIKLFSCSTQLSTKFLLLINVKMPTIVGILTFMSGKNSILGLS